MANLSLRITRDSVCAGDDCDAPHFRQMEVSEMMPLKFVIQDVIKAGYLPKISGDHATLLVNVGKPVAVAAQQWNEVHFFADSDSPIAKCLPADSSIHFQYEAQKDPDKVFKEYNKS